MPSLASGYQRGVGRASSDPCSSSTLNVSPPRRCPRRGHTEHAASQRTGTPGRRRRRPPAAILDSVGSASWLAPAGVMGGERAPGDGAKGEPGQPQEQEPAGQAQELRPLIGCNGGDPGQPEGELEVDVQG